VLGDNPRAPSAKARHKQRDVTSSYVFKVKHSKASASAANKMPAPSFNHAMAASRLQAKNPVPG